MTIVAIKFRFCGKIISNVQIRIHKLVAVEFVIKDVNNN